MLVVAFDGVLFDTLPLRATAILDALSAEGIATDESVVNSLICARTIAETVRECVQMQHHTSSTSSTSSIDETTIDLVTLRAERTVTDLSSRGALLNIAVRDKLRRAASVTRIVIRADSRRREVEPLLALAELDSIVSFVRCADDMANISPNAKNTLERSYDHIARRMAGNMNLLGESSAIGIALEASESARIAARALGFEAPENFSTARLPGTR